jgi:two-component system NtrC family sensor kinase
VQGQTVLVVDDNEMNRDVLARRLSHHSYRILQAEDGPRALEIVRTEPRVDIILLDYMMPGMNGFEVLQKLKGDEQWRHIPVIMISADNELDRIVECIEAGAEDYLAKPFNPVLLKARLHACIEKRALRDKEQAYVQQIQANQQQLVMQQKLSSIGALTAGIAYEIKTPLNYVNNFADLNREYSQNLLETVEQHKGIWPDTLAASLSDLARTVNTNSQKVLEHGQKADQIIKFMLTLSRPSSNAWQRDNIHALLDQAFFFAFHVSQGKMQHFTPKLEKSYDPHLGEVMVISQDLCQAFLNMIENAFYSLFSKSHRMDNTWSPLLKLSTSLEGESILIRLYDNGEGIPQGVLERIFDPFFTTKTIEKANGLGLSMAKEAIVDKHKGKLWAQSEPGEWAEFFVEIPRKMPETGVEKSPAPE